ncbi:MAG: FliM/FliN family flagellar motor switch protein [Acidobacteria bacterium]|nr:FliM/FliN family flagellar motor switch protein [Acidobacteriota bacterium]
MLDIRCTVDFVLGTSRMPLLDCLLLAPQAIVPLAQAAGSDLSVVVHGVTIASGEVVILDDKTALRISRVAPPIGIDAA